jgi:hypothetical protein
MKSFILSIRLTWFFILFFVLYLAVVHVTPTQKFDAGALTLFSVNSFLYGFYIAPILGAQKMRIEDLHRIIRAETNALFDMVLHLKSLPDSLHRDIQAMYVRYIKTSLLQKRSGEGEKHYEALITFCVAYKGTHEAEIDTLLTKLVQNQQNRTQFNMQMANRVYSNEWWIMIILFSITLGFVIAIDINHNLLFEIVKAFLCTSLTMLIIILVKLNTLTHKKAQEIWDPLKTLLKTNFYRFD